MSLLKELSMLMEESKAEYENAACGQLQAVEIQEKDRRSFQGMPDWENLIVKSDNLSFMKYLIKEKDMAGKINLIYIDPPFFSKASYDGVVKLKSPESGKNVNVKLTAYDDIWEKGLYEYLKMLASRFYAMKELLTDDGCFWIHLDWHVVHYVKIILDEIFGEKNFVNEIVWNYKSGGTSKRHFSRKHDTLLFYSKTPKYYFKPQKEKSYNRDLKPYRFKGVKEYRDETGWYTMVNMKDVWSIDMVGRTSAERTGYATQKPEALLMRIVESCCPKDGICADFFGGSATLSAVAEKTERSWICCDAGGYAVANAQKRMSGIGASFAVLEEESTEKAFEIEISSKIEPIEFSDKKMLTVSIASYKRDFEGLLSTAKDEQTVKSIAEKDPLSLIDYWSVDTDYDGKTHRPQHTLSRGNGAVSAVCQCIGTSFGKVSVRVVDVFGNSRCLELRI